MCRPYWFKTIEEKEENLIIEAPPRPSGTVRVKLKYKGRSKPIPMENPKGENDV